MEEEEEGAEVSSSAAEEGSEWDLESLWGWIGEMEAMERQVAIEDSARHERYPIEWRERKERSGAKSVER